jgi:hypothetical protein
MGRIFGLLLVVLGIWAATEVYLHGTAGAFGGAYGRLSGDAASGGDLRSLGQRAGDSVRSAQAAEEARREKLLGE